MSFVLDDQLLTGLFYLQRYRYLSIEQFVYITGTKYNGTSKKLAILERLKLLGHFGNVPFGGRSKAPKVYYLTRKGHAFLLDNMPEYSHEIGGYKKVKVTARWSSAMEHNLKATDVFLTIEKQIKNVKGYHLLKVLLDRKMEILKDGRTRKETTDFIDDSGERESKIIPDGAFILERLEDKKRVLFFLELDNGTEAIAPNVADNFNQSIQFKFSQYVHYLESLNYRQKYGASGDFKSFRMLFVTTSNTRAKNVSSKLEFINPDYRTFFYISNLDDVRDDIFFNNWLEPCGDDSSKRPLVMRG